MRGWFVSDDGKVMVNVSSVVAIWKGADRDMWSMSSGSDDVAFGLTPAERDRLIAQIEAENADSIAVKEQMFHHDGGGFLLSEVRSYCHVKRGPPAPGMATIEAHISVQMGQGHTACSARVFGSDIPRFLAAMGVPNEPT